MSVQNDIHTHLATLAGNEVGKQVAITPVEVAKQMDLPGDRINKTFFNLNLHEKIAVRRGENGRAITGYTLLELPGKPKATTRAPRLLARERQVEPVKVEANQSVTRRRSVLTPHLDSYSDSKAKFQRLSQEMGDLVTATFNDNPYAEEGLQVLGRLRSIEDQYVELRRRSDEQERDLKALRSQLEEKVRIKANGAGVTVKHGD